ncbi:hypothetical protein VPNG_03264 [Cytospora leucostoma]|uniref:C2H2-type domain-containing protein n=1 Tax=Cytospora leucostoma TaxID=1230097 RepID=A0A423XEK4_9PEZI|nr:hypothetical protein VPNG_03264 [Cytospora leucostoma]
MYSISTSPPDESTREQSLTMESQTSRDTGMTDDTIQFPWSSDDRFAMPLSHPFLSVESVAVQEVVNGFQNWNLGGGTTYASGSLSIPSSSTTQQQAKRTKPWKRPSRDGADDEGSDNNGQDGPPPKKRGRKKVSEGQPRLACHFQKRFPERHPTCGGFTLIAYVKGHLRSKHTRSPYYCPRCNSIFKTDDERDEHIELIISSPCKKQAYDTSTEISASMAKQLHKRVEQSSELREQWFSVWDTIFPGVPRPPTHTYDICSDLPVQVLGLYTYLENEGPGTVVSFLQRHGLVIAPKTPQVMPPDLETYIRRVLFQACREIYQNWQSQRELASPVNSSPSNVSNTGPDTPVDTETGRNTTGDVHMSFGPSPQVRTTTVPCTSSSASNEGINGTSLPTNTNSRKMGCVSASASQNQPLYLSPSTPISMYDGNSNGSGLPRRDSTASGGSSMLVVHTPQDGSLATLQYSYEYEHIADTVFEFDMPAIQDFNPGFQEPVEQGQGSE